MPVDRPLDPSLAPLRDLPIIAHLGTRWDPAWHRPHRLLRALAAQAPVLLVAEPVVLDDVRRERLDVTEVAPGIVRALPRLPAYLREYDRAAATTRALLQAAMRPDGALGGRFTAAVQWFAHAAPAPEFLDAFGEAGVAYDCLTVRERAAGGDPSGDRAARERALLQRADLVLAAGARATELESLHRNVLRVDDGVDIARWGTTDDAPVPADIASLPRPVIGYVGPVDDRLDHALLRALVAAVPEGSVVLVGPPGRVPADGAPARPLPRGVRWLGARDEAALPAYVRGFDACAFPFVAGHPTLAGDPPPILECLAAGRSVVSSVGPSLPAALASMVRVASEPRAFAAAAVTAAAGAPPERSAALAAVLAADASWEQVAHRLRGALFEAIATRPTPMAAIADAIIASRGLPPGAAPGAR